MARIITAAAPPDTPADNQAAFDQMMAELTRLNALMDQDRAEIDRLRRESDQLRTETRTLLLSMGARL